MRIRRAASLGAVVLLSMALLGAATQVNREEFEKLQQKVRENAGQLMLLRGKIVRLEKEREKSVRSTLQTKPPVQTITQRTRPANTRFEKLLQNLPDSNARSIELVVEGSGDKSSSPFTIEEAPWLIAWNRSSNPSSFGDLAGLNIYVCRVNGGIPVEIISSGEGTYGTSAVYEAGRFYLKISSANCHWGVAAIELTVDKNL